MSLSAWCKSLAAVGRRVSVSYYAGDVPIPSVGVLWKSRIPKWGSVPFFSAFCMIQFAMSTKCSAFVLDCVQEGELVA